MATGEYARALFGPEKPSVSIEVEMESGEQEVSDGEIAVAAELLAAQASGDAKRYAKAIRASHVCQCAMDMSSDEPMDD